MPRLVKKVSEGFGDVSSQLEVKLGFCSEDVNDKKRESFSKQNLTPGETVKIIVRYYLTNNTILTWETTYINNTLYIEVPHGCLPDASKDAFVALLEYAEEVLLCNHAIVYFSKEREDRASLIRTFMFMGFFAAPPESPMIDVPDTNNVYMVYKIR